MGVIGGVKMKTKRRGFCEELDMDHSNHFVTKEFKSLNSQGGHASKT